MSSSKPGLLRHWFAVVGPDCPRPLSLLSLLSRGAVGRGAGAFVESLEGRQLLTAAPALPAGGAHGASVVSPAPAVVTDKQDYYPGEKAVIRGSGFRPGEEVRLQVLHTDGTPNTAPEHRPWVVRAGTNGKFRTTYLVGNDDLNTALQVTAVGVASHRSAREAFTDSAPANDNFSARATLTGTSATASGTNVGATKESGEPNHAGNSGGHSVWWTWTAPSAGNVTIDTSGSTFDTLLAVYTGTSVSALTPVPGGSNDDSPAGATQTSQVTFAVTAGQAYPIAVDGFGGATGTIALHVNLTGPLNLPNTTTVTSNLGAPQGAIAKPSHVVIVVEEDRAAGALGDPNMPYTNSLASGGLVFTNSHGVNAEADAGEMNYLALYSGSTQGIHDDGWDYTWSGPNLAKSLFGAGLSFTGYSESLPADGSQAEEAVDPTDPDNHPDSYLRSYNPMAQFTDVGPSHTNADVNKTFNSFPTNASGFANLPTVSFVIPDLLHNTHGSNDAPYTDASNDYDTLRANADGWLKGHLDAYAQWARQNNSLLIVTGDEGDRGNPYTNRPDNFAKGVTTIVSGDPNLVVPGTDSGPVNQYSILRTVENMYGLAPLGNSAAAAPLDTDAAGRLAPAGASGRPSAAGQAVTFTATVRPNASNSNVPSGSVQFKIDGSNYIAPVPLIGGSASALPISSLAAGGHTVTAAYTGDNVFAATTSATFTHTVNGSTTGPAATATTLISSANPSSSGQPVTLTATVAEVAPGTATPTGFVTFEDNGNTIVTGQLDSAGKASVTTSALSVGTHPLTAVYGGDANDAASTSANLSQVVNAPSTTAATTTSLASSANPSTFGQGVTFTATVAPSSPDAATPTGVVTFSDGSATLGTGTLNAAGQATFTTANLSVASHPVTASYAGDGNFAASATPQALTQVVNPAATTTAVAASVNPSHGGQSVTFTATVTPTSSAPAAPGGTVQFKVDGANLGSPVTLVNRSATSPSTTSLAVGAHTVTAVYSGNANFSTSTSAGFTQTVRPANDNFSARSTLGGTSATASGTNVAATKETGEPNHAGNSGGHSVWYAWTPTTSGTVTIDTSGSSFDTLLAVYTGSSVSALTAVPNGSNDDSPAGGTLTSKVTFSVTAGTAYDIAVDGYAGATGSISLHLAEAIAAPKAPSNVSATDGTPSDRVRVTWTASSGATAYQVFRATTNNSANAVNISGDVTATTYDDTTATKGKTYYYWVKAKNAGGTSGFGSSNSGFH